MSIFYFIVMVVGTSIFGIVLNKRLCAIVAALHHISNQINKIKKQESVGV